MSRIYQKVNKVRYSVDEFVQDCTVIVARRLEDRETVALVEPLMKKLIGHHKCLEDLGGDPFPETGFDIHLGDALSVQAIVWQADTRTPTHNHNSWVVLGVLRGAESNTTYRRIDDGSTPWHAKLEKQATVITLPGETAVMIPRNDIHSVHIAHGTTHAIHVYGTDIHKAWRCTFDPESGVVKPFGQ